MVRPARGAVVASVALLKRLHPYKLDPAPESVPGRFDAARSRSPTSPV